VEFLIALLVVGCALAVALVLPVLSFLRATRADRDVRRLTAEVTALRREIEGLHASRSQTAPGAPAPTTAPDATWRETVRTLQRAAAAGVDSPMAAPPSDRGPDAAGLRPAEQLDQPPPLEHAPTAPPPLAGPEQAPAGLHASDQAPPPRRVVAATDAESLEQRIGGRWLLYAGMGALVLGISYFIKFAFDNGWVSEPLRVAIGLAAGVALLVAGLRFSRRGLALFGHVLAGGGIVVLYLALYAALHVYGLIGPSTAFSAMTVVTAVAAFLANRERAQALAVMALVGGFATPFLVGGDRDAQRVLFTYVALLLAGSTVLALRHTWPVLHLLGYGLTAVTVLAWGAAHYSAAAWLRTELFLTLYTAMFLYALFALRRHAEASPATRLVVGVLATVPFVYNVASFALLGSHPGALLVYVVLATVAGLSASHHTNLPWLRSVVLVLIGLPLMAWMDGLRRPGWYAGAVITTCAVYGLHLAGQWRAVSDEDAPAMVPLAEIAHTHLNGLFLPTTLYLFLEDRAAWWNAPMLTALAGWNAGIAWMIRARVTTLPAQYAALAATLTAVAIGMWFDGPAVAVGWAMEGAALGWLAVTRQHRWLGAGSVALFVIGALRLLEMLSRPLAVTSLPVVNTRTLAAGLVIGAALWMARVLRTHGESRGTRDVLIVGAHVLAIAWMSAELHAIFGQRAWLAGADDRPVGIARAELFEQVALSVAWGAYAVALIAAGIARRYAPARYLGITLFGVTIVKVVTRDIAELDRVYQMLSVLGVGGLLLLASYLYQRTARTAVDGDGPTSPVD
jgi:uncharacterized membrane protein